MESHNICSRNLSQCEKCPNTEFFLVRIQSEYRKIWTKKNSVSGHFSCSVLLENIDEDIPMSVTLTAPIKDIETASRS